MNWFKRDLFLGVVILAVALVLAGELWLLVRSSQQARRAFAGLEVIRRERDAIQHQAVPPNEVSERAIGQELADLRLSLEAARVALTDWQLPETSSCPAKPIEGYFDIASFVEKSRALAAQAHVAIKADERFGFSSHASDGPARESLAAVHAQRVVVQFLVGILFEAQPSALLSVQRERPETAAQSAVRAQARSIPLDAPKSKAGREDPADFFELSPTLSLRVPGVLDANGFALEFSGPTRTLRDFLNRLAACELPLIVRSVEAGRLRDATSVAADGHAASDGNSIQIVGPSIARFRVVVELVKPWPEIEGAE